MTKHGMRGFASGVIVATAIVGLFYFQVEPKTEATTAGNQLTEKTVQNYLNSNGEIAVDKKMFDKWQSSEKQNADASKTKDSSKKTEDQASKDDKAKTDSSTTKKEAPTVYKATVQVKEGMTTSDVAAALVSQHVIKDKYDLINYVVNNKLEPYLQLGTYTLSSDMTIAQIAAKITSH